MATVPTSSSRTWSDKWPTYSLSNPHLGLSHPKPSPSMRYMSPAMVQVLNWISRSVSSSKWMDIDKRDAAVVRQELRRHTLPNSTSVGAGDVTARFSTSSSIRRKRQMSPMSQQSYPTYSATKLGNDNIEDSSVGWTEVPQDDGGTSIPAFGPISFRRVLSPRAARRWSHDKAQGWRRSSLRDGKATSGNA